MPRAYDSVESSALLASLTRDDNLSKPSAGKPAEPFEHMDMDTLADKVTAPVTKASKELTFDQQEDLDLQHTKFNAALQHIRELGNEMMTVSRERPLEKAIVAKEATVMASKRVIEKMLLDASRSAEYVAKVAPANGGTSPIKKPRHDEDDNYLDHARQKHQDPKLWQRTAQRHRGYGEGQGPRR